MSTETVARRYAAALADVVLKTGDTESVKSELKAWEELIGTNDNLQTVFSDPSIAHLHKKAILDGLLSKTRPSKTTSNFLRVLLENGRLMELREINTRFDAVLEERSGNVVAKVTSARELTEKEKAELNANLEKLTGKHVRPAFNIDQQIIGGVVTQIGSTIYDGSVKTQLEKLKEELIGG